MATAFEVDRSVAVLLCRQVYDYLEEIVEMLWQLVDIHGPLHAETNLGQCDTLWYPRGMRDADAAQRSPKTIETFIEHIESE